MPMNFTLLHTGIIMKGEGGGRISCITLQRCVSLSPPPPRVYEKFMEAMQQAASNVTGIKKKLGMWATGKAFQGNVNKQKK